MPKQDFFLYILESQEQQIGRIYILLVNAFSIEKRLINEDFDLNKGLRKS